MNAGKTMKKKRFLQRILLCVAVVASTLALSACNCSGKNPDSGSSDGGGSSSGVVDNIDSEIVVGGDTNDTVETAVTITGATDIHLSKKATDIDEWSDKVTARKGNETYPVTVDISAIKFGEMGTYKATYSYLTETVTVKVTVYDSPSIVINGATEIELKYSEVYQKLTDGIVAKDCFGETLATQIYSYGGARNGDGSFEQGRFTIKYAAIDNAGQIVFAERSVTIVEEKSPVLAQDYVYDVENESFAFALSTDDFNALITLSIDGVAVPSDKLKRKNGKVLVDGEYIYSAYEKNAEYDMRVMTAYGYSVSKFTMKDEGTVAYDDAAIVEFVKKHYCCFKSFDMPQITLTNHRQDATPVYELASGENAVTLNDGEFIVDEEGEYILRIILRKGQVLEYPVTAYYDLGFENGACYDENADLTKLLSEEYTLKKFVVKCLALNKIVLTYKAGDDIKAFNDGLAKLNKKFVYELKAVATRNGRENSQTTQFTVADSTKTQVALSDEASYLNGEFTAKNPDYAALEYSFDKVGGRTNAFRWYSTDPTVSESKTLLRFGDSFKDTFTQGKFVTFDIFIQKPLTVCVFLPGIEKRLWLDMEYYDLDSKLYKVLETDTEEEKRVKAQNRKNYDAYYSGVRFFDEKGDRLTTGGGFQSGALSGRWITVELQLPEAKIADKPHDVTSNYCGISVYNNGNSGVYDGGEKNKATYISNVKVSDERIMDDATVNEEKPDEGGSSGGGGGGEGGSTDGDAVIKDLWSYRLTEKREENYEEV